MNGDSHKLDYEVGFLDHLVASLMNVFCWKDSQCTFSDTCTIGNKRGQPCSESCD